MQSISELRKEYLKATLDVGSVNHDPLKQFEKWFNEARRAELSEPNAMSLATVNENGRPTCRIVLLKGIEFGKFVFFTNYQSQKGTALSANPACALTFYWPELERQVRIEGTATPIDPSRSDKYFQTRPRGAQLGTWASPQSSIIENREILDERMDQIRQRYPDNETIPRPNQWGGYDVEPLLVEFWQGRVDRLHDRIQYVLVDNAWQIFRLAP